MATPFSERFPAQEDIATVQERFIQRINSGIFLQLQQYQRLSYEESRYLRDAVITVLGIRYNSNLALGQMVGGNFRNCLRVVETCYRYFRFANRKDLVDFISTQVRSILGLCDAERDLGLEWQEDHFTRKGVPDLDGPLMEENLKWLVEKGWENVRAPLSKAFTDLRSLSGSPNDVARDCYEAIEALAKNVTGRAGKDLSTNAELLIKELNGSAEMKSLLKAYIDYANALHRHATPDPAGRKLPKSAEVEFYLYMSTALVRFARESL